MLSSTIIRREESNAIPLLKFIQLLPRNTSPNYKSLTNHDFIVVVSSTIPLLNASQATMAPDSILVLTTYVYMT
jgi:hypothetical protein